jgi:hypothetical protein
VSGHGVSDHVRPPAEDGGENVTTSPAEAAHEAINDRPDGARIAMVL